MDSEGRSSKVEVRDSGVHGWGWFATEDIPSGEIIFRPYSDGGKFDHKLDEILSWPTKRRRAFFKISYQVDDETYNGYHSETECTEEQRKDWHLNHSCDPNVWYLDKDLIATRRDIRKGEELVYDYATSQANEKMNMKCDCGTAECRGNIRGDDWMLESLQRKYGEHWLPFIRRKIKNQKESLT